MKRRRGNLHPALFGGLNGAYPSSPLTPSSKPNQPQKSKFLSVIDTVQAVSAYSRGDTLGGTQHLINAGVGVAGYAFVSVVPVAGLPLAIGGLAIGAAQDIAMQHIANQEKSDIAAACAQRDKTAQQALSKLKDLRAQSNGLGCCP
jgi:hypothetical protein